MSFIQSFVQKLGLTPAGTIEERKAQYNKVLMAAMDDGVLSDDEIEELDQLRKVLKLKDDDVKALRLRAFQKAVEVVKADGLFTPKEERDLEKIKGYLGVVETDVVKNRVTLAKMRVLYEIHRGNLPLDEVPGLGLEHGEQCHFSIPAVAFEARDAKGIVEAGPIITHGKAYRMGEGRLQALPESELTQLASGSLTITTRRFMFNSGKTVFRLRYEKIDSITVFTDGFVAVAEGGVPRVVKLADSKDMEVISAIVSRYLNPPPPKPPGPARPGSPGSQRPPGQAGPRPGQKPPPRR